MEKLGEDGLSAVWLAERKELIQLRPHPPTFGQPDKRCRNKRFAVRHRTLTPLAT